MKYFAVILLILISMYPLSYAKYNLKKKNRLAATGAILIAVAAIVFPAFFIFTR